MIRESEGYWLGHLAMSMAVAATAPNPQQICRDAVKAFLADRPQGDQVAHLIREAMRGAR